MLIQFPFPFLLLSTFFRVKVFSIRVRLSKEKREKLFAYDRNGNEGRAIESLKRPSCSDDGDQYHTHHLSNMDPWPISLPLPNDHPLCGFKERNFASLFGSPQQAVDMARKFSLLPHLRTQFSCNKCERVCTWREEKGGNRLRVRALCPGRRRTKCQGGWSSERANGVWDGNRIDEDKFFYLLMKFVTGASLKEAKEGSGCGQEAAVKWFSLFRKVRIHFKTHHGIKTEFSCFYSGCDFNARDKYRLDDHINSKHTHAVSYNFRFVKPSCPTGLMTRPWEVWATSFRSMKPSWLAGSTIVGGESKGSH